MKRPDTNAVNNGAGWLENLTIPTPCYCLNGELWHQDETPCGADVLYHLSLPDGSFERGVPAFALDAILTYRETLRALLLAGF